VGGQSARGKVTLSKAAPPGGTTVALSSSDPSVTVPNSVTVPAGSTAIVFTLNSTTVATTVSPVITATAAGFNESASVTVEALSAGTIYVTPDPGYGDFFVPLTLHVRLNAPAPSGGTTVTLSANPSVSFLPSSVTVAAGNRGADTKVFINPVAHDTAITYTATANGVQMQSQTTVLAPKGILSVARNHINFGGMTFAKLTLNHQAPSAPMTFTVTSDKADVIVPATVNANTTFTITSTGNAPETANLTLTYDNQTLQASVNVVPSVTLEASAWAKVRGDLRNSGQGLGSGATGYIKWSKLTTVPGATSQIVGDLNGTAYYLSGGGSLYAVSGGSIKWIYAANAHMGPVVGPDGTIYVVGAQNVQAVNPQGNLLWRYNSATPLTSLVTVGSGGKLYVASDHNLQAISAFGKLQWSKAFGDTIGQPVASPNGNVIVSGGGLGLSSVAADGTIAWSESTAPLAMSQPAIGADGTIYLGYNGGKFSALNPDGTAKWNGTSSLAGPTALNAVESNGTVYVATSLGTEAFSSTGTSIWTSSDVTGNVAIGPNGLIYSGSDAFNANGTVAYSIPAGGAAVVSIGTDGTEYRVNGPILQSFSSAGVAGWQVNAAAAYFGEPGVAPDQTVYAAQVGSNFLAFDAVGAIRWISNPTRGADAPLITQDGTIYTSSATLDSNGVKKSSLNLNGSAPSLGADGSLYTTSEKQLIAQGLDGSLYWTFSVNPAGLSAVGSDGSIFLSDTHGNLHSVSMIGTQNWSAALDVDRFGPVIGPDGTVYVTTRSGNLVAVNPANGSVKWNLPVSVAQAPLAVATDGSVVVTTSGKIWQVSSTGTLNWTASFHGGPFYVVAPSIASDGTIYVPSSDGVIRAYSSTGSLKWSVTVGGEYRSAPVVGPDGTVYILAAGSLIAIG